MESNRWGIWPTEYKVLIEPEETDELAGRHKIIFKPDTARDREAMAKVKGTLIAVGGNAFEDWQDPVPKVGDRVYFAKYAGIRLQHQEDRTKWATLCNDKDIAAIVDPNVEDVLSD